MDKLTEDQKQLVEENVNLAYWYARKMFLKDKASLTYDDYLSACLFGLTKAARSFHPEKSKLATFAVKCMQNEIFMMYRKVRNKMDYPYSSYVKPSDDWGVEIDDADYFPQLQVEDRYPYMDHEFLSKGIIGLNEREIDVIRKRYYEDKNQQQIGKELNLQQSYISRVEKKALRKLNEYYKKTVPS